MNRMWIDLNGTWKLSAKVIQTNEIHRTFELMLYCN